MAVIFTYRNAIALLCIMGVQNVSAQMFRGGPGDGHNFALASTQPLGRNIFTGGANDGNNFSLASNQPLGRNIFIGGANDGVNFSLASNQPLGRNIFIGGVNDGVNFSLASNQPLGGNIFKGGADDGVDFALASNQPLGSNIFTGGSNDGWAMGFAALATIPVTLSDFSGRWRVDDAMLVWKTSMELNTANFELQRSFDGNTFTPIASVPAAGQSSTIISYQYADINVKNLFPAGITTVYYRLRTVDRDGKFAISGIVVLRSDRTGIISYAVYPNPASNLINISSTDPVIPGKTFVQLVEVGGRNLIRQQMTSQLQQLNVSSIPSGTYFLQLISADKIVYTQKIIIQK